MPSGSKIGTVVAAVAVAFLTLPAGRAQTTAGSTTAPVAATNTVAPVTPTVGRTNQPPASPLEQAIAPLTNQAPAATNTPPGSTSPAATPAMAEADRFFAGYGQAARFVRQGADQEAFVVMDVLTRNLRTSPWLEIGLLKRAELSESANDTLALADYDAVLRSLTTTPYYQGAAQRARLFSAALQGAAQRGIARARIARIRRALDKYFARYLQYPESLAKLAIFNYIAMEDISDANRQPFRYVPTGLQFRPTISYQRYDLLDPVPPEPFSVRSPRLESTSRVSENPEKYIALVRVPGRMEPRRVSEDQTMDGYFVGAISAGGAVVVGGNRVLVLPVPP